MAFGALAGARILVVEDEFYLADDARSTLVAVGAVIIGPVPTIGAAAALVVSEDRIDGALLDVNLRGQTVYELADALQTRGVPFAFVTGYDSHALPERFSDTSVLKKPAQPEEILELFGRLVGSARGSA